MLVLFFVIDHYDKKQQKKEEQRKEENFGKLVAEIAKDITLEIKTQLIQEWWDKERSSYDEDCFNDICKEKNVIFASLDEWKKGYDLWLENRRKEYFDYYFGLDDIYFAIDLAKRNTPEKYLPKHYQGYLICWLPD